MRKLAVCYPGDTAAIFTAAFHSMVNLRRPDGCDVQWFRGVGWCQARRRAHMCEQALEWGADLIVQLDADQVYEPDVLERLVARHDQGYAIVAAMVPGRCFVKASKVPPFGKLAWRLSENGTDYEPITADMGEMVQAEFPTSACVIFPAAALTILPRPWYYFIVDAASQKVVQGEDGQFFHRLMKKGFPAWVDTTIQVKHCHVFEIDETFSGRFADWGEPGVGDPTICNHAEGSFKRTEMKLVQAKAS